jgi:hypothetical protein
MIPPNVSVDNPQTLSSSTSENPGKSSPVAGLMAPEREDGVVDTLGEALAGVSLLSQSGSTMGSAAFAGSSLAATSKPSTQDNDGWGNFTDHSNANSSGVFPPSVGISTSTSNVENEQDSIRRFLSQDPSQSLGDDVFRLSHTNLPSLNYEPSGSDAANVFRYPGHAMALGSGSKNSYGNIHDTQEPRDSPIGTGTTASSRSASPYANNHDIGGGAHSIPAYQQYTSDSGNFSRNHTFVDDEHSSAGFHSLSTRGSSTNLSGLERATYSKPGNYGGSLPYDQALDPAYAQQLPDTTQQQQPQVLYMAVPAPDGRGQVLQPVQMLQVPGKPYSYVVPNAPSTNNPSGGPFFQQELPHQKPMIVLPPNSGDYADPSIDSQLGFGTETAPVRSLNSSGGDDFAASSSLGLGQFQTDPILGGQFTGTSQRPPLEALLGQVRRLSRDQVGCRLVQQALDEEGPTAATLILNEGLPFWGEAMVDPFGNYLFQKILEKITPEERIMLIKSVSSRLVNASLNLHGTRSVQKVVELCAVDDQQSLADKSGETESAAQVLTSALAPAAARLCIDSHGNHVIQRILLKLDPRHSKFVFDAVAASVGDVARHRHGCCVIQRCLDSPQNEPRANLVLRIVDKSLELMQDAYGNYVVQYVLDVCSDEDVQAVCESVAGKVNLLAIQKFSSNVMEKCLERCSDRVKAMYLAEMSDTERIRELMMDPFGNYVVQRALSVATHEQAIRLVEAMRPHLIATQTGSGQRNGGVRNTAGGRRIIAKICRRFPNFTLNPVGSIDELYSQNRNSRHVVQHPHGHAVQHPHGHPVQHAHGHPIQLHHGHHVQHNRGHQLAHHQHHQQQQPALLQSYTAVGGPVAPNNHFNDPRMTSAHSQPPQSQQPFYGFGGTDNYYDPFNSGHGGY